MIAIDNWEWPQYVILFWWIIWFIVSIILRIGGVRNAKGERSTIYEYLGNRLTVWSGQIVMFIILMHGGFWS